ncbi:MAG: hypothetical protein ACSLFB_00450 [Acidimicrobiales bacterium]
MTAQTISPETSSPASSSSDTRRAWVTFLVLAALLALTVSFYAFTTTNTPASVDGTSVTSSSATQK